MKVYISFAIATSLFVLLDFLTFKFHWDDRVRDTAFIGTCILLAGWIIGG